MPANWTEKSKKSRALLQQGKLNEAKAVCSENTFGPEHFESSMLLAEIATADKDPALAAKFYESAIGQDPNNALAHYKLANALKDRHQFEAALNHYDRAAVLDPNHANTYCNRGVVLQRLNRPVEALASYEQGASLNPADALIHFNRGTLLQEMRRPQEALACLNQAIAAMPTYVAALYNRGILLHELDECDAALADYDAAVAMDPSFGRCYLARGNLQRDRKQLRKALADYERSIAIDTEHVAAYCNKGAVLAQLKQFDEALDTFDLAISIDPTCAEAHGNRGDALLRLNEFQAAVESYDRAVAFKPDFVDAHANRGEALLYMRQFAAAVQSYDQAVALQPHGGSAMAMRRHANMYLCNWNDLGPDVEAFTEDIESGAAAAPPLAILALIDSPRLHQKVARDGVRQGHPADLSLGPIPRRVATGRICLGYFSADFCEHPVAVLSAQFLELHDRSKFEVIAFSFGPDTQDPMRKRLEKAFDQFLDVRGKSDHDVALLSRKLGIDVAIDLNGHTAGSRTGIFALRAAPVQIGFLGYPGTMGAEYIDYIVADATVIPKASREHYSEKILYLPDSFLPHDSGRVIAARRFAREQLGLPSRGTVFCCFNNSYKILPATFDSWMKILSRVDDSVLWLSHHNATAVENLRREAQSRGVNPRRLIFADRMPSAAEHLARFRAADLFLDTLPYNAHATALDALWSGLPILTRSGQGFAGRVGASLLMAIGLPDLITSTAEQYEDLAVELAENPPRLEEIRLKLERNRLTSALFDTPRFTRNLERAYARAYERFQGGLPPDHIHPN